MVMSLAKILIITALVLFGLIGTAALLKSPSKKEIALDSMQNESIEIDLEQEMASAHPAVEITPVSTVSVEKTVSQEDSVEPDRIEEFFNKGEPKLPIVETITYKSRVNWLKGRAAWLSDYAAHYDTSRHFIARSLNGQPDYLKQDLAEGDRFNVLRKDKNYQFHLVIDTSTCKLRFYYIDLDTHEKVHLKTYLVSLGRPDNRKTSGLLTPLGRYEIGSKVAIYKPSVMGFHKGQKVEMVRVFGTRWIPFEKEIGECTEPAKGFGLHGVPWVAENNTPLCEDTASLGKYESDGCVRLATADIEEIFAIVISKPTVVELVSHFSQAKFLEK